jgi:hypothetical protein
MDLQHLLVTRRQRPQKELRYCCFPREGLPLVGQASGASRMADRPACTWCAAPARYIWMARPAGDGGADWFPLRKKAGDLDRSRAPPTAASQMPTRP